MTKFYIRSFFLLDLFLYRDIPLFVSVLSPLIIN